MTQPDRRGMKGAEMFEINDLIMYGARGVCRVKEITHLDWDAANSEREYYVLEPLYKADMVYVPVDNQKVYMRHVMSKQEVLDLIDSMPEIESKIVKASSIQQLSRYYQAAIDSHECSELVRLTKSIHLKQEAADKNKKQLGQIDIRYMEHAEDLLFGEIAAVLDIPRDSVVEYIEKRIESRKSDK